MFHVEQNVRRFTRLFHVEQPSAIIYIILLYREAENEC